MFTAGMSQEQLLAQLQAQEVQRGTMSMEMAQMKQMIDLMQQAATAAAGAGQGQGSGGNSPDWGEGKGFGKGGYQSLMEDKHFRRVDKFEGNPAKFKSGCLIC